MTKDEAVLAAREALEESRRNIAFEHSVGFFDKEASMPRKEFEALVDLKWSYMREDILKDWDRYQRYLEWVKENPDGI